MPSDIIAMHQKRVTFLLKTLTDYTLSTRIPEYRKALDKRRSSGEKLTQYEGLYDKLKAMLEEQADSVYDLSLLDLTKAEAQLKETLRHTGYLEGKADFLDDLDSRLNMPVITTAAEKALRYDLQSNIERAVGYAYPNIGRTVFAELGNPAVLIGGAALVLVLTIYGGEIAEAVLLVLTLAGVKSNLDGIFAGIKSLIKFFQICAKAKTEEELKEAGNCFSDAAVKLSINGIFLVLACGGMKAKAETNGFEFLKPQFTREFNKNKIGAGQRVYEQCTQTKKNNADVIQSYLDKLNQKSIKKLTAREDKFEILQKYADYYGDNIDFVNGLISKTGKNEIYVDPAKLLKNYAREYNSFDDFAVAIGKDLRISSKEQKVKYLQDIFDSIPQSERKQFLIPDNAEYVIGFGTSGRAEYHWSDNLGLVHGSDYSLVDKKGVMQIPDKVYRVGELYGKNFTDDIHSYNELGIPYRKNITAGKFYKINKQNYTEKIDALASGNIDKLNSILISEGRDILEKKDFNDIRSSYTDYLSSIRSPITCNPKYGICGIVAEVWNENGTVKWFDGGAPQFITPLSGFDLKALGIILEQE